MCFDNPYVSRKTPLRYAHDAKNPAAERGGASWEKIGTQVNTVLGSVADSIVITTGAQFLLQNAPPGLPIPKSI